MQCCILWMKRKFKFLKYAEPKHNISIANFLLVQVYEQESKSY